MNHADPRTTLALPPAVHPTALNDPHQAPGAWAAFDLLVTLVAVADRSGRCLFANACFEDVVGVSRRSLMRGSLLDWLVDPMPLQESLESVARNEFATGRFEGLLRRGLLSAPAGLEPLPVHVFVTSLQDGSGQLLVQLVEIRQQTRQDREDRVLDLAQATKELIRNLAHEIKNPLGGIRGAAQLLAMEIEGREDLAEYTTVIVNEADRLQHLVDRLLAPHRQARVVGDVNIHEVCERVRVLIMSEFGQGLEVVRDYDASLPEFRGDLEQMIQVVLNIVRNAAQALEHQRAQGQARILLRTRALRQVTVGKRRWRLALELHIEDNGPGIPVELLDRIFFPLVSGRDGGSGLGLTLAQTFVQQHQGTIECESVPGRTLFKILIPLP
ncbi:MAG: PAS domain-containing sensor histidine kinase [Betaproteobacteria bacterium]|jgi:two-component system, NtrC family, nitrogen regulation sensor histidine kinase GlnL|nr:PAS domain-containing sensor histidine kinase [Betaproteobacteria bacterium]NBT11199.1 PAS domain-containing sensor histidine kinase [Betaproteobacteria bacterium]NBU49576.1 PAS domain-containing sensor histidine kinase [Betaproteobacteria bacterium]NBX97006.1 PAS domain-containing sensor histidine kinase [Betaproteobacteria bacterium]